MYCQSCLPLWPLSLYYITVIDIDLLCCFHELVSFFGINYEINVFLADKT